MGNETIISILKSIRDVIKNPALLEGKPDAYLDKLEEHYIASLEEAIRILGDQSSRRLQDESEGHQSDSTCTRCKCEKNRIAHNDNPEAEVCQVSDVMGLTEKQDAAVHIQWLIEAIEKNGYPADAKYPFKEELKKETVAALKLAIENLTEEEFRSEFHKFRGQHLHSTPRSEDHRSIDGIGCSGEESR